MLATKRGEGGYLSLSLFRVPLWLPDANNAHRQSLSLSLFVKRELKIGRREVSVCYILFRVSNQFHTIVIQDNIQYFQSFFFHSEWISFFFMSECIIYGDNKMAGNMCARKRWLVENTTKSKFSYIAERHTIEENFRAKICTQVGRGPLSLSLSCKQRSTYYTCIFYLSLFFSFLSLVVCRQKS